MAEINVNVGVVVPETPKSVPNEQLSVYVPYASKLGPGIVPYATDKIVGAASFYHVDFDVTEDGQVKIKQSIHNRIDYAVNTIGGESDQLIWDSEAESYTHLELKTNAKQLIPAINENKDSIDALSKDVKNNKDRIGVGTIIDPNNGTTGETGLVRLANANRRKLDKFVEDVNLEIARIDDSLELVNENLNSHDETLENHEETLNNHADRVGVLEDDSAELKETLGQDDLDTNSKTIKGAINESFFVANSAIDKADTNRLRIVNLDAQMQGISRTYVVDTFLEFIDFLNGRTSIPLREDRDGDGVEETYSIYVYDLKTVDNIIIVEDNVPDFWIEKNSALSDLGSYTYNGTTYSLGITVDGSTWGRARILETDITIIKGHATSAAVSASNAAESEKKAQESAKRVEELLTAYIDEVDALVGGDS